MNSWLRDLYGHQSWADAEHWRVIEAHLPAREDPAIRNRLHHIHLVQRSFMWSVGDRATRFAISAPGDFDSLEALKQFARGAHAEINRTLEGISEARLQDAITMPWFRDPPLTITVGEALTQCAMHSQWHRGQNAARLRELGAAPPAVDLIVWYWKGRPAPAWDGVGVSSATTVSLPGGQ